MTVFKGFLILTKRNINIMFMYIAIFMSIAVAVQKTSGKASDSFKQESLRIAVIDHDKGELARGLAAYLEQYHTLVDVPDDMSVIQDRMFYRDIYYTVIIPESFETRCLHGSEQLPVTKIPGSNSGFYVDQQINTFLNDVRIMTDSGFSLPDAIAKVTENGKTTAKVSLLDKNGYGGQKPDHAFMFQFMPYVLISILCYCLAYIMIAFHKPDVMKRMMCSSVPIRSQNIQLILGYFLFGICIWGIFTVMAVVLYGKGFLNDPNLPYYLANSFLMTLVSLSLAFLVSTLITREELVNAIVNVISLGMSFLCGVFVDLEIISKSVKTAAQFLPVYWYEKVNNLLSYNISFSPEQRLSLYTGYGLQILFAAAILGVGLVISKNREMSTR